MAALRTSPAMAMSITCCKTILSSTITAEPRIPKNPTQMNSPLCLLKYSFMNLASCLSKAAPAFPALFCLYAHSLKDRVKPMSIGYFIIFSGLFLKNLVSTQGFEGVDAELDFQFSLPLYYIHIRGFPGTDNPLCFDG